MMDNQAACPFAILCEQATLEDPELRLSEDGISRKGLSSVVIRWYQAYLCPSIIAHSTKTHGTDIW